MALSTSNSPREKIYSAAIEYAKTLPYNQDENKDFVFISSRSNPGTKESDWDKFISLTRLKNAEVKGLLKQNLKVNKGEYQYNMPKDKDMKQDYGYAIYKEAGGTENV